jgi:hypothetical protein
MLEQLERAEQDYLRVNGWNRDLGTMNRPRAEQIWTRPGSDQRLGHDDAVRVQKAEDRSSLEGARGAAVRGARRG